VAVTKIDKLTPRAVDLRVQEIADSLGLAPEQIVPFSAVTGVGRDELAAALVELLRS
jgi:GTP-binding protein